MSAEAIQIKVIGPDGSVEELDLDTQDSLILGSGSSANVRLDGDDISSIHAMIKSEDGKVRAIDLGSESGIRIGGKDVREQDLQSGDVVEIGGYKIQVSWGVEESPHVEATKVVETPEGIEEEEDTQHGIESEEGGMSPAKEEYAGGVRLFSEVIPPEERPSADNRMLEVVMVWSDTIIGVGHFTPKDGPVTVGDSSKVKFNLASDLIPEEDFGMVEPDGDDYRLNIGKGMGLQVRDEEGNVSSLDELVEAGRAQKAEAGGYTYKLGLHEQVVVNVEDTSLIVRYVRPSKRIKVAVFKQFDYYFTKVFSTSVIAHMLFIAALLFTPVDLERLSDDLFANPNRFAQLIVEPEEEERAFEDISELEEQKKEDETKFGEIEEEPEVEPEEDTPVVDVDQREEDREKVLETGLLAALEDGAGDNVFGADGLGTGINEALGGIDGEGMGDAWGLGGLGSRGAGAGGGAGALGIGGLGTKGGGKGGHGQVDLSGRDRAPTKVSSGRTVVEGGLDREVIARVVRRHQNEIRYCYERELQRDPNLHGRIAVQWIIDGTGQVARATIQDSTMANSNVENCIIVRVRRWRFPEPRGGGIVRVTYPWIFSPRG